MLLHRFKGFTMCISWLLWNTAIQWTTKYKCFHYIANSLRKTYVNVPYFITYSSRNSNSLSRSCLHMLEAVLLFFKFASYYELPWSLFHRISCFSANAYPISIWFLTASIINFLASVFTEKYYYSNIYTALPLDLVSAPPKYLLMWVPRAFPLSIASTTLTGFSRYKFTNILP